jgi:hypothetical protein
MKANVKQWQSDMKQFHRETQEGLGTFEAAIVRPEHSPWILQSDIGEAFSTASKEWKARVGQGWRPLCLACEYEFTPESVVHAFAFMLPTCEEPTRAMLVGVCEECSAREDEELLEITYQGCRQMGLATRKMVVGTG